MEEITELHIGDRVRVTVPVTHAVEEGDVSDISYRFEPHPKDTPFEPYLPPIPTACVNGVWHDIDTLRKLDLPEREDQRLREELDNAISDAAGRFYSGFNSWGEYHPEIDAAMKGIGALKTSAVETTRNIYVRDGYTYEVAVRIVAWPGMDAK